MFCGLRHFIWLEYLFGWTVPLSHPVFIIFLVFISCLRSWSQLSPFLCHHRGGRAPGLKDLAEFSPWESSGNGRTGSSKPSSPPCTGAAIMRLKEEGGAFEGLRPIANQTWHETLIGAFCAGSDDSGWWDSGLNPCTEISAEYYFLLVFMILLLTTDNLLNDLRETSLEECLLTFAEEVTNTSLFC